MGEVWHRWGAVVVVSAIGLAVIGVLLASVRPLRTRKRVSEIAMVAGTAPWIWMILTRRPGPRLVRLDPASDVHYYLTTTLTDAIVQIVGNLLVFAAFGYFAPVRWPGLRLWQIVALAAAGSALVETLQYVLDLGRVSSVDDVILNAAGAGLFAVASFGTVRRWTGRSK